jgi:tRNA (guanine37-N1)-methyltransferase
MTPQGKPLRQERVKELSQHNHLLIICGHYEGVDERVRTLLKPEEISIGDYILTGGELPAMVLVDAVARMLPGVLGESAGGEDESFYQGLLEYPQYTRPQEYRGLAVPEVLISGHHEKVDRWRREQALRRTWERRPELLGEADLTEDDRRLLAKLDQSKPEKE